MPKGNSKTLEIWKRFGNYIRIFLSWSQGSDGNLTAKSYHPTIIKINMGIPFLLFSFMTRRKQKVTRLVKYNPTLQRPFLPGEGARRHTLHKCDARKL